MAKKIVGYKPTPGGGRVPIYEGDGDKQFHGSPQGSSQFVTDSTTTAPDTPEHLRMDAGFKPIVAGAGGGASTTKPTFHATTDTKQFHATGNEDSPSVAGTFGNGGAGADPPKKFHAPATSPQQPQFHAPSVDADPPKQFHADSGPWAEPERPELLETAESEEYEKFEGIKGFDSELFQSLSEADRNEAVGIFNARGQEAFAEYLADKAIKGEGSNISYSPDSLELIDNAKKAFASGGFGDFFLVADEIDVLGDPKASEEEKAQARARVTEILNNPTKSAAPRTE